MKSGRYIIDGSGNPVAVEYDPDNPATHAAAHSYEDALAAGAAFKKLTPAELAARAKAAKDAAEPAPQAPTPEPAPHEGDPA